MIKYGLISETDSAAIERTIDKLCSKIKHDVIRVLEVGLYAGETGNGVKEYIRSKGKEVYLIGVDNKRDGEELRFEYNELIVGNSNEVHHKISDGTVDLCLLDACHCFTCVVTDFYAYSKKVRYGGFLAMHDTGKHIQPFTHFQHGDINNPLAYISVREALNDILELDSSFYFRDSRRFGRHSWHIREDVADVYDEAGGIVILERTT